MDDSIDAPEDDESTSTDVISVGMEMPVEIDTLEVDGIRPEKGDSVNFDVAGTVTRIVDNCVYVRVETANDQPIKSPAEHGDAMSESGLMAMSEALDKAPY